MRLSPARHLLVSHSPTMLKSDRQQPAGRDGVSPARQSRVAIPNKPRAASAATRSEPWRHRFPGLRPDSAAPGMRLSPAWHPLVLHSATMLKSDRQQPAGRDGVSPARQSRVAIPNKPRAASAATRSEPWRHRFPGLRPDSAAPGMRLSPAWHPLVSHSATMLKSDRQQPAGRDGVSPARQSRVSDITPNIPSRTSRPPYPTTLSTPARTFASRGAAPDSRCRSAKSTPVKD